MPKLMIVDDDHTMVSLLTTLLELDGFEVFQTTQSAEVEERIRSDEPDLVIMDVFLTSGDGIELLRQMRSMSEFARLPVIMVSGMDVEEQCMQAGANGYIMKQEASTSLIQAIDHVLEGAAWVSERVSRRRLKRTSSENRSCSVADLHRSSQLVMRRSQKQATRLKWLISSVSTK